MSKLPLNKFTKRNKFTRMCMGEAVIALMKEKSFSDIKILDITRKTGVSRMTFYKYYRSKEEVVESYLQEIISGYIENNHGKFSDNFPSFENCQKTFRDYFQCIRKLFPVNNSQQLLP